MITAPVGDAIREFGRKLKRERGAGLFYYAGHGMQPLKPSCALCGSFHLDTPRPRQYTQPTKNNILYKIGNLIRYIKAAFFNT